VNAVLRTSLAAALSLAFALSAAAQGTRQTIDETLPRIVKIFGAGGLKNLHEYGTGFLVGPEGHVVTIWNHVLDTDEVSVVLDNGRRFEAEVLGAEPQMDLAVLKLKDAEGTVFPHFDLDAAGSAQPGTRIRAFSNMFKVAVGDEPVSVLHGVVAARTRLDARRGAFELPYDGEVYVMDAITNNPGSGGGVVLTRDGVLIGMIGREVRSSQTNTWINYAIPITELRETIGQIMRGDYVAKEKDPDADANPNRYQPLDFGLVMVPDVVYRTPAYVDAVQSGTAAAEIDLRPDDLVLFVNDQLVHSIRTLRAELGRLQAGDTLTLIVRRGNDLVTVQMPVRRKD
jgi:serine protease Do